MPRPTPYDLVFRELARERFAGIRAAAAEAGLDARDRDGFLLLRETAQLLRELRPDEGLGEGIDHLAALVHHAYLFWADGEIVTSIAPASIAELLGENIRDPDGVSPAGAAYVQLPAGRLWASVVPDAAPEPMDGCFVSPAPDPLVLRILGVFGVRPDRDGFSVVEAEGGRPSSLGREDGSPLFSSTLPAGDAAGLHSLQGAEELLELGWRVAPVAAGGGAVRWTA